MLNEKIQQAEGRLNIKKGLFYEEQVLPVFERIKNIQDPQIQKSIEVVLNNFSENTTVEELSEYMLSLEKILDSHSSGVNLVQLSSEVERQRDGSFKGLIPLDGSMDDLSRGINNSTDYSESIRNGINSTGDKVSGVPGEVKKGIEVSYGESGGESPASQDNSDIGVLPYLEDRNKDYFSMLRSFFTPDELDRLEDISLNTKIDKDNFVPRFGEFISEIQSTKYFQKLKSEEQQNLLKNLNIIKDHTISNFENVKNASLKNFDNYLNNLGEQVKSQPDSGTIVIKLNSNNGNGETLSFSSKKEAFDFLQDFKSEMYYEMEDNTSIIYDKLFEFTLGTLGVFTRVVTKPHVILLENVFNYIQKIPEMHGLEMFTGGILLLGGGIGVANYTMMLIRKVIDFFAIRLNPETSESKFVIPDYRKSNLAIPTAGDELKLYNEYMERLSIIQKLEERLHDKTDVRERIAYQKKLDTLKKYLNVNTSTFKMKAGNLLHDTGNFRKFTRTFTSEFISFRGRNLVSRAGTDFNTKDFDKERKEGISFLFDDADLVRESDGNLKIEKGNGFKESDNVGYMRHYIDSQNLPSEEKARRHKNIDALLKSAEKVPFKSEEVLKRELYGIAVEGHLNKDEIRGILEDNLKKLTPPGKKNGKPLFSWLGEHLIYQKNLFLQKITEIYGKNAPTTFTKGQAEIIQLLVENDKGNLIGYSRQDLDDLIKNTNTGKIEFNRIYPGFLAKSKAVWDIGGQLLSYARNGNAISLTQKYKNLPKIQDSDYNDAVREAENYRQDLIAGEKFLTDSDEFKALKNVINLGHKFDNGKEIEFEKAIKGIEAKGYTKDKAKMQVLLMSEGFLPEHYIIEKLEFEINSIDRKNPLYKEFKEWVEAGKWFGDDDDLKNAIKNLKEDIINGNDKLSIVKVEDKDHPIKSRLDPNNGITIDSLLEDLEREGEKLGKQNFKKGFGVTLVDKTIDGKNIKTIDEADFKNNEGKLAKILGSFDESKLNDFLDELDKGLDFRFDEYLNKMNDIIGITFNPATVKNRDGILTAIGEKIQAKIQPELDKLKNNNLTLEERIEAKKEIEKILYGSNLNNSNGILDRSNQNISNIDNLLIKSGVGYLTDLYDIENIIKNNENLDKLRIIKERVVFTLEELRSSGGISDVDYHQKLQDLNGFSNYTPNIENDIKKALGIPQIYSESIMNKVISERILNTNNQPNSSPQQNQGPQQKSKSKESFDDKIKAIEPIINRLEAQIILEETDQAKLDKKLDDLDKLIDYLNNKKNIKGYKISDMEDTILNLAKFNGLVGNNGTIKNLGELKNLAKLSYSINDIDFRNGIQFGGIKSVDDLAGFFGKSLRKIKI